MGAKDDNHCERCVHFGAAFHYNARRRRRPRTSPNQRALHLIAYSSELVRERVRMCRPGYVQGSALEV